MKILLAVFVPGVGDTIIKTPLIRAIGEAGFKLDVVGFNRNNILELIEGCSFISEIYEIPDKPSPEELKGFQGWLAAGKHDYLLCGHNDERGKWLHHAVRQAGIKPVRHLLWANEADLSFYRKARRHIRQVLTKDIYVPWFNWQNDIDSYLNLFSAVSSKPVLRNYETFTAFSKPVSSKVLEEFGLKKHCYVTMQPGAADGNPTPKRWDPASYRELAFDLLNSYPGLQVVILGSDVDLPTIGEWPAHERLINLCGRTTLYEVAGILKDAAVTLSGDSGLMHLSNAVRSPTIALLGPTNYVKNLPLNGDVYPLFSKNESFMCMTRISEQEAARKYPGFSAMTGITPYAVREKIDELLLKRFVNELE